MCKDRVDEAVAWLVAERHQAETENRKEEDEETAREGAAEGGGEEREPSRRRTPIEERFRVSIPLSLSHTQREGNWYTERESLGTRIS